MALRSAARIRRALARHSTSTCIFSGTRQSHLCFTPITLVIHSFLSRSHFLHLWVNWSAKLPLNASLLTCQGLEASFYKAFINSLVFCKGFTYFYPFDFSSMFSLPSVVSSQPFPGHFPCSKHTVWPMTEKRRPTLMPLAVILLPIYVSGKTIGYLLWVLHFLHTRFKILYFPFLYLSNYTLDNNQQMEWLCSRWINISIIIISHKTLKKALWSCLCKGNLWTVDRAGIGDSEVGKVSFEIIKMIG